MPDPAYDALLPWYRANRRDLPWRRRCDPCAVWVSEIMLQQTGVSTVIPYFERWMQRFPSVEALALADEQEVLATWQGLGYYRRCRNLLMGAKLIAESGWPKTAAEWLKIPGVGKYTAGAIASIALGEPTPLVDGNVERVYARLTGDGSSGSVLNRRAWLWAAAELRSEAPGDWNQALMELGATVCTPVLPRCDACPLVRACVAKQGGRTMDLPTPSPKRQVVMLAFEVRIAYCEGRFGLRQIPEGEWWAGMWEFPRIACDGELSNAGTRLKPLKHVVTHHRITLYPVLIQIDAPLRDLEWLTFEELANMPMPAAQRKLLHRALDAIQAQAT